MYPCTSLLFLMSVFRQYGIQSRYSSISDQELDDLVRGQSEINDNVGSNFIIAMLLAKGVKVFFNLITLNLSYVFYILLVGPNLYYFISTCTKCSLKVYP